MSIKDKLKACFFNTSFRIALGVVSLLLIIFVAFVIVNNRESEIEKSDVKSDFSEEIKKPNNNISEKYDENNSHNVEDENKEQLAAKEAEMNVYVKNLASYNDYVKTLNEIVIQYNDILEQLTMQNNILDEAIRASNTALSDTREPYDITTREALKENIKKAQNLVITVSSNRNTEKEKTNIFNDNVVGQIDIKSIEDANKALVLDIDKIILRIEEQKKDIEDLPDVPDNSIEVQKLMGLAGEFLDSIEVKEQVTQPKEEFIKKRLKNVPGITTIKAVTEDHDPNKHLNQNGWYTSCVYFGLKKIDQESISGNDIIDKGTVAGGCIEVYASEKDVEKREKNLSQFDDTLMAPGSRYVVGTILIRISRKLSYEEQADITLAIANEFTRLD